MTIKPNDSDGRSTDNTTDGSDLDGLLPEAFRSWKAEIEDAIARKNAQIERQNTQIDALQSQVDAQQAEIEAQQSTIDSQTAALHQNKTRIAELEATVEALEREQTDYRESNERDKADIRQDVTENTRQTEASEAHTEAVARKVETLDGREQRTPLEQIVRLPEEIIHKAKLTANQRRARSIAMEIGELSTTVPKGMRLDSTTIKDQLKREYGSAHDQTVARVMAFLDRLGGERTEVVHTGKGKAVIFDDWLARRLQSVEQFTTEAVDRVLTNVVSVTPRKGS
ncbi:hypothetical protein [Halocatena halophila]|uniref:hypothetical protein n=1 Tax=Halocatena halophila TaxID=2814576 RepID=UPI002ED184C2